ncbi:MAG: methionyl-tRNA formyltransferase [Nitrospirae bacterium]|nr:methionyl-tRNA formyltransferase [Nitrospirota bacterium]
MSLIFFGTPHFAVPSLQALISIQEDVALVVTQPDKLKGRGHVLASPPVKELASAHGIDVIQPSKIRSGEFYQILREISPEFIIAVAYGKILPEAVLGIPAAGCINVHGSLLPKYRGAAPVQWALINGEKITGVTTIMMDSGMDTGDMLMHAEIEIQDADNSETLAGKLAHLGARTLVETIEKIRSGAVRPVPQPGGATYAPPLRKEDGRIDWKRSAEELLHFVKGMYPWPSAFSYINNEMIKIIRVKTLPGAGLPGRIEKASGGQLVVGTGRGLLLIEELQPHSRRIMTAGAFLSGRRLKEGYETFS